MHQSEASVAQEAAEATIHTHTTMAGSQEIPAWLQPMITAISAEWRKIVRDAVTEAIDDGVKRSIDDGTKQITGDIRQSEERIGTRLDQMVRAFGDQTKQLEERIGPQSRNEVAPLVNDSMKRLGNEREQSGQTPIVQLGSEFQQLSDEFDISSELKHLGDEFRAKTNQLCTRLAAVEVELHEVHCFTLQAYTKTAQRDNRSFNDVDGLDEVPFPNDVFPWGETVAGPGGIDVKLPVLSSLQAVRDLSPQQTYGYFKGYYPQEDIPEDLYDQKRKILAYIGRRDIL